MCRVNQKGEDMKLRDIGLKSKIMSGGLIPVIFAMVILAVALFSFQDVLKSVYWVDYTHRTLRLFQQIYAESLGMEADLRGFLLTGDKNLLKSYSIAEENINKLFPELRKKLTNEERMKLANEALEILESWKKTVAVPAIELRKEIGSAPDMNEMVSVVAPANEKMYLGRFRDQISSLTESQKKALDNFREQATTAATVQEMGEALRRVEKGYQTIQRLQDIYAAVLDSASLQRSYLLSGKEETLVSYNSAVKKVFDLLDKQKDFSADNPATLKSVQEMEDVYKSWAGDVAEQEIGIRKQIASSKSFRDIRAFVGKGEDRKIFEKFKEVMNALQANSDAVLKEREKLSEDSSERARYILVAGMALTIIVAFFVSYFIARTITKSITAAVDLAESISKGQLSKKIDVAGKDEVGRLCASLNSMAESLRLQIRRVSEGISILASSSAEISTTVAQLSASASKTSAAITETTTTVEEVKQAARISSEKAKKVAEGAQEVVHISESGRKAADDTVQRINLIKDQMETVGETVVKLSEQSVHIEEIIEAVQDLADQSNLLAVNASIEAARAGEQGKGFAVVAHEIKSLADQSKAATEQVRGILDETRKWVSAVVMATEQGGKAVDAGVKQAVTAGESIQSLASTLASSTQAAMVIRTSNEQQFAGVDQVASAMLNIEQSVQHNVAGITQLEAAAKRIAELGSILQELVRRYET
jgi:methyl-accepting chemotaxis protein